jgi:hypothetical protein
MHCSMNVLQLKLSKKNLFLKYHIKKGKKKLPATQFLYGSHKNALIWILEPPNLANYFRKLKFKF